MSGYGAETRAFNYAILASIVVHGLVLFFALPLLRESGRRPDMQPGPIVARLAQPRSAPAASPPADSRPAPRTEEPAPRPVMKPSPLQKPASKAATTPTAALSPQPAPSVPSSAAAPSAPTPSSAASAPATAAKAESQPSADTADSGSLAQYRLQLIAAARRYKRYPRVAMDNNWEGTTEIMMMIGANGMISSVSVRTSSGHTILDEQAVEMFRRAKPLVPIPAALRGKEFAVPLRAIYSLTEPGA